MRHRFLPIFNAALLTAVVVTGCGKSTSYRQPDDDDDTVYNVGIISENGNTNLEQGFRDALEDTLGEKHVNIVTKQLSDGDVNDTAAEMVQEKPSVILTESESALSSTYSLVKNDDDTSVISTNVQDILRASGAEKKDDDSDDDRTTGINVTGISSNPYVSDQLSELIEATPNIRSVGILYSPDDTDTVKVDRTLETFLTQAGIEYREYILPSKLYKSLMTDGDDASSTTLLNSIRNSDETDPTVPLISENFAKRLHPEYTDEELMEWEQKTRKSLALASDKKIINTAVRQNDALYIAGGSLDSKISSIATAAKKARVATFGGDQKTGQQTLVTLWSDPYDTGYQAGKMAYQILANGQKASDMQVLYRTRSSFVKLYNKSYADALGLTFGKSFHEYSEYMKDYTPGSNTTRVEETDE
ncbi:MAG: ABC transporter substrate binding protein [Lachnospiraceae bacterium]|nr:ABC transporter substrate binding protein [Lachnospiraceae bacterium]